LQTLQEDQISEHRDRNVIDLLLKRLLNVIVVILEYRRCDGSLHSLRRHVRRGWFSNLAGTSISSVTTLSLLPAHSLDQTGGARLFIGQKSLNLTLRSDENMHSPDRDSVSAIILCRILISQALD
jgi:hypothetical protein